MNARTRHNSIPRDFSKKRRTHLDYDATIATNVSPPKRHLRRRAEAPRHLTHHQQVRDRGLAFGRRRLHQPSRKLIRPSRRAHAVTRFRGVSSACPRSSAPEIGRSSSSCSSSSPPPPRAAHLLHLLLPLVKRRLVNPPELDTARIFPAQRKEKSHQRPKTAVFACLGVFGVFGVFG